jgi:hypothetical protein
MGLTNTPFFMHNGVMKELCRCCTTRDITSCPFGKDCNKYRLSEEKFLSWLPTEQSKVDKMVEASPNVEYAPGFSPKDRKSKKAKPDKVTFPNTAKTLQAQPAKAASHNKEG